MSAEISAAPPPSGRQVEIVHGEQRAVVVEVGGGLREYVSAGEHVLDGYRLHERCSSGRGQILAPWPNRLRDGSYEWDGERQQLALSEPPRGNAIHGLTRWASWSVAEHFGSRAAMEHVIHPQDGYPFTLALRVEYELRADGLTVATTASNLSTRPCPYGVGAHPYLTVGTQTIDECLLRCPAAQRLQTDDRAIPTGSVPVADSDYDFRVARPIGALRLDTCFTQLDRDADGRARVQLSAGGGRRSTLWVDEWHEYLMIFTGDTVADESCRRRGLAVEPMTCAPNALRSGEGLQTLQPGESFTSRWGIAPG